MELDYKLITNNRIILENKLCLCLDCFYEFYFDKIGDWADEGQTAICPYCWDDTILLSPKVTNLYTVDDVTRWHMTFISYSINKNTDIKFIDEPGCYFKNL